jgi:hypothetical protein
MDQIQELMAFVLIYVQTEEIELLGWAWAADLAAKRDRRAAEALRLDCEGA